MKRLLSCLLLGLCLLPAKAQNVDERIGGMLNASDWFALERELPTLKDSIQYPFLRVMAEALASMAFGRDDEAVTAIDTLIANYQQDIGFGNTMNMVLLKSQVEARRQNYAAAADIVGSFVSQVKAKAPQVDVSNAELQYKLCDIKRNVKPSTLERPAQDVAVEAAFDKIDLSALGDTTDRGYMLCIPASVNGRPYTAVFDTGSPTTFCSMDFARKVGARLFADTIPITGTALTHGFTGVIDSINVGSMTFRNAEVVVVDGDMVTDSLLQGDFVLGLDFMKLCGEVQFYPEEGKIVFPASLTPLPETGHNLYLTGTNGLRLEAYVNGERLDMSFDTGNSVTTFSKSYYDRHKQEIDSRGQRVTRLGGGVGSVSMNTVIILPPLALETGGDSVGLGKAGVYIEGNIAVLPGDGNAGLDIIQGCRKVTLNLKDLFLKIED